jgi:hypothetical protein
MKNFEELSDFQQAFYTHWYSMLNTEKQIIVFPELKQKSDQEIERISGKKRKYSALDGFIESLEQHRESNLCIISNSTLELEMRKTGKEFLDYLGFWTQSFGKLAGTNLKYSLKMIKKKKRWDKILSHKDLSLIPAIFREKVLFTCVEDFLLRSSFHPFQLFMIVFLLLLLLNSHE